MEIYADRAHFRNCGRLLGTQFLRCWNCYPEEMTLLYPGKLRCPYELDHPPQPNKVEIHFSLNENQGATRTFSN